MSTGPLVFSIAFRFFFVTRRPRRVAATKPQSYPRHSQLRHGVLNNFNSISHGGCPWLDFQSLGLGLLLEFAAVLDSLDREVLLKPSTYRSSPRRSPLHS